MLSWNTTPRGAQSQSEQTLAISVIITIIYNSLLYKFEFSKVDGK